MEMFSYVLLWLKEHQEIKFVVQSFGSHNSQMENPLFFSL